MEIYWTLSLFLLYSFNYSKVSLYRFQNIIMSSLASFLLFHPILVIIIIKNEIMDTLYYNFDYFLNKKCDVSFKLNTIFSDEYVNSVIN